MSVDAYDKATVRLAEIKRQIEALRNQIKGLEREAGVLVGFIDTWHSLTGTKGEPSIPYLPNQEKVSARGKNPSREEVGAAVEKILRKLGRPVPRTPLFEEVQSLGLTIHGQDPEMVFSTMMWRMRDRFVRLKKYGYWFKDEPCAFARYQPEHVATRDADLLS